MNDHATWIPVLRKALCHEATECIGQAFGDNQVYLREQRDAVIQDIIDCMPDKAAGKEHIQKMLDDKYVVMQFGSAIRLIYRLLELMSN